MLKKDFRLNFDTFVHYRPTLTNRNVKRVEVQKSDNVGCEWPLIVVNTLNYFKIKNFRAISKHLILSKNLVTLNESQ